MKLKALIKNLTRLFLNMFQKLGMPGLLLQIKMLLPLTPHKFKRDNKQDRLKKINKSNGYFYKKQSNVEKMISYVG